MLPDLGRGLPGVGNAPGQLAEGAAAAIDHGHDRWGFVGR
jgi:hypothetical protein